MDWSAAETELRLRGRSTDWSANHGTFGSAFHGMPHGIQTAPPSMEPTSVERATFDGAQMDGVNASWSQRGGRFGPSPYGAFNHLRSDDQSSPSMKARHVPEHLVGRPARIPAHEMSLQRRKSGRRWLGARMVRMQAMDDMRPRESRVQKRRERAFDAGSSAAEEMKGYIPQLNASGTFEMRCRSLPDLRDETALPEPLYQAERPHGQVPFMPSFHQSRFPNLR